MTFVVVVVVVIVVVVVVVVVVVIIIIIIIIIIIRKMQNNIYSVKTESGLLHTKIDGIFMLTFRNFLTFSMCCVFSGCLQTAA